MTMRNYDYTFYLNARTWLDMHKIEVDEEDAPVLGEEDIMNITGRGDPVVIRGVRHGPLAKSQTIPKVEPAGPKKKSKAAAEQVPESHLAPGDQRIYFVIAPKSNTFSKKDDIERITWRVPLDGTAEIILASAVVAPQLAEFSGFMRNISHATLEYNSLRRFPPHSHKVIRDPEEIRDTVLWDTIMTDLSGMPKMRASTDKFAFWLDAHPGDVVASLMNAEDTCAQFDYRHVIR